MKRDNKGLFFSRAMPLLYALGLLGTVFCAGTTWWYRKQMHLQYQVMEQRFHAIAGRYLAVDTEQRLVSEYYPYVLKLHEQGILGQERRLDWIVRLQYASRRAGIADLHYRIGAQTEFKPASGINSGNYRVYYSPMQIDLDLLHEGKLRTFFAELDRHGPGMHSLASCRLSRMHKEINQDTLQGNVRVECDLLWFNIRRQDGGVIDLS